MADADQILSTLIAQAGTENQDIVYQWLIPNLKGFSSFQTVLDSPIDQTSPEAAPALNTSSEDPNAMPAASSAADAMSRQRQSTSTAAGTSPQSSNTAQHQVSIFLAATEAFSQKNTNCSIAESVDRFRPLVKQARDRNLTVRAYISVALGCPFEGPNVSSSTVADLAATLLEMGADEISVADTTGTGTAPKTRALLKDLAAAGIRNQDLALHFHDTYGQALLNVLVALEHGVSTFDSSVGGLGGCPFSPGATGNLATEDLVYTLHSLGATTGVDLNNLSAVGAWITDHVGKPNSSRAGKAILSKLRDSS